MLRIALSLPSMFGLRVCKYRWLTQYPVHGHDSHDTCAVGSYSDHINGLGKPNRQRKVLADTEQPSRSAPTPRFRSLDPRVPGWH